jgi:hypothetical protein
MPGAIRPREQRKPGACMKNKMSFCVPTEWASQGSFGRRSERGRDRRRVIRPASGINLAAPSELQRNSQGQVRRAPCRCTKCSRRGVYYVHADRETRPQREHDENGRSCSTALARAHTACKNVATYCAPICRRCSKKKLRPSGTNANQMCSTADPSETYQGGP